MKASFACSSNAGGRARRYRGDHDNLITTTNGQRHELKVISFGPQEIGGVPKGQSEKIRIPVDTVAPIERHAPDRDKFLIGVRVYMLIAVVLGIAIGNALAKSLRPQWFHRQTMTQEPPILPSRWRPAASLACLHLPLMSSVGRPNITVPGIVMYSHRFIALVAFALRSLVPVAAASAVGFALHKAFADWLPGWLSSQMAGVQVKLPPYGPEVVVPAALSSVEYGAAFLAAYILIRRATPQLSTLQRALLLAVLCLALQGAVLRFPFMQLIIGNPVLVTVVQHATIWLPYVAASLVLAYTYEALADRAAVPTPGVHMQKVTSPQSVAQSLAELWSPRVVGELDDSYVKVAKVHGTFGWHHHEHEDELFFILKGRLRIELESGFVELNEGEMFVVPKGVQHNPVAEQECLLMLIERKSTLHTGNVVTEHTRSLAEQLRPV